MDIIEKARLSQKKTIELLKSEKPRINSAELERLSKQVKIRWPKPLAEAAFHGLTGKVVKMIEPHSEADPVALLINLLTTFGNAIGPKAHFKVEGDIHSMKLFAVLVGETSKSRKGSSWGHIRNLFKTVDQEWGKNCIQSGLSSGEGLIWAVRDKIEKNGEITDEGVNDKRLLIVETEFSSTLRVLGREGNTLSAIVRNAWDIGTLHSLTKNSKAKATGAHISILGHVTKDELLKYLSNTEAASGFGNRFLWICVKRSKTLPFGGGLYKVNFKPIIDKLLEAVQFSIQTEKIKWAEKTRSLWAYIYPSLSEGKPGLLGSMTARSEAYVTRLACIYALLDKSPLIKPEHLKAALAVWDYADASARYIFRDMTGNELADDIVTALTIFSEGLTRTDISNHFARHKSSHELSEALDMLLELGVAEYKRVSTGGRDKEIWFLRRDKRKKRGSSNGKDKDLNSLNSLIREKKLSYLEKLEKYIAKSTKENQGDAPHK